MSIELMIPPTISSFVTLFSSGTQFFPVSRVFFNESALCIRLPKYRSLSFSISLSKEYLGLISFRIDWFVLLSVQGTLKSLIKHNSKASIRGRSQHGGGIGWGDHFLFYKVIERKTERWTKFTKQLLIASSGHQAPRKAAHCLRREVGQKY